MRELLIWIGRIAGVVGALICVVAIVARLAGQFWLAGFQSGTLLQAGIAAMVLACLAYTALLAERTRE